VNVQDLCDLLQQSSAKRVSQGVLPGGAVGISDPFTDADLPTFLEQSVLGVNDALANPESQKGAYVGGMEHNAFLASFQRARQATSRSRLAYSYGESVLN
jgi:hypothetical protein